MSVDFYILNIILELRCGFLDFLMPKITMLGNGGFIWITAAVIMCLFKKQRKTGIMILSGLLIGFIVCTFILKPIVARPRPCWIDSSVPMLIDIPHDYSFPSGHTLSSFVSAFILMYRKSGLRFIALALAVMIAFSRMYLYVHFPSDVLGGLLIAAVTAVGVIYIEKKLTAYYTEKKAKK